MVKHRSKSKQGLERCFAISQPSGKERTQPAMDSGMDSCAGKRAFWIGLTSFSSKTTLPLVACAPLFSFFLFPLSNRARTKKERGKERVSHRKERTLARRRRADGKREHATRWIGERRAATFPTRHCLLLILSTDSSLLPRSIVKRQERQLVKRITSDPLLDHVPLYSYRRSFWWCSRRRRRRPSSRREPPRRRIRPRRSFPTSRLLRIVFYPPHQRQGGCSSITPSSWHGCWSWRSGRRVPVLDASWTEQVSFQAELL